MFKICISEPKSRKAYQIEKECSSLIGATIGSKFDGSILGLNGFTLKLTGGSDKSGFPMRPEIPGSVRKKILMSPGIGFSGKMKNRKKRKYKIDGIKKRKYVCGNQIGEHITQINVKIVEGEGDIGLMLGIKPKETPEKKEEKVSPAPLPKEEKEKPTTLDEVHETSVQSKEKEE